MAPFPLTPHSSGTATQPLNLYVRPHKVQTSELSRLQTRLNELPMLEESAAHALLRDVAVFGRQTFGVDSPHVTELESVMFEHPTIIYNTGHYKIKEEWNSGVRHLRSILQSMEYDLQLSSRKASEPEPPSKITIQWLLKHVPIALWSGIAAAFAAVFVAGYTSGTSNLIPKLVALVKSSMAVP